jgi:hypothetical protein
MSPPARFLAGVPAGTRPGAARNDPSSTRGVERVCCDRGRPPSWLRSLAWPRELDRLEAAAGAGPRRRARPRPIARRARVAAALTVLTPKAVAARCASRLRPRPRSSEAVREAVCAVADGKGEVDYYPGAPSVQGSIMPQAAVHATDDPSGTAGSSAGCGDAVRRARTSRS